jgi:transketolase
MSSGIAYGPLGATHHSIEDMAWTRAIANMTVVVPADPIEMYQAVYAAYSFAGPVFLRISRKPVPIVHPEDYRFQIGRSALLRQGSDVTLIANGTMVTVALQAADLLATEGIQSRVLNLSTVRPIDRTAIEGAARETGAIVTIEEHTVYGGLGGAVAEVVVTSCPVPMRILGFPGIFMPTGSIEWLFENFGLTPESVCSAAKETLGVKILP